MRRHKSNIGLRRYQRFFGFPITEIKGKRLLDIGSARAQFQTEAEKVGAMVISVDPAYQHESVISQLKDKTRKFAARVQNLPFKDSAFDIAFARRVIPDKVSGIERYQ